MTGWLGPSRHDGVAGVEQSESPAFAPWRSNRPMSSSLGRVKASPFPAILLRGIASGVAPTPATHRWSKSRDRKGAEARTQTQHRTPAPLRSRLLDERFGSRCPGRFSAESPASLARSRRVVGAGPKGSPSRTRRDARERAKARAGGTPCGLAAHSACAAGPSPPSVGSFPATPAYSCGTARVGGVEAAPGAKPPAGGAAWPPPRTQGRVRLLVRARWREGWGLCFARPQPPRP